jgi:lysophospholipase L1-like esterase
VRAAKAVLAALAAALLLEGGYRAALALRAPRTEAFELYAIGESTAVGDPYPPRLSFPEQAAALLGNRVGDRVIDLTNLARAGNSIYPQAVALASRVRFRRRDNPAAVFIYSGHNEHFTEPRRVGPVARAYFLVRDALLYRSFLASDLAVAVESRLGLRGRRSLADYERHLRRAIEFSLDNGATPTLAVPASNLTGVEPTLACPEAAKISQIARARLGRLLEAREPRAAAERFYRSLAEASPCLAPLAEYRLGKLAEKAGDYAEARRLYVKARDDDPHNGFGRTNSAQEELLRRLAAEYKIPLVDAPALFAAASPHGLIGGELMSDGHHPNIEGQLLLARAFAQTLSADRLPLPAPKEVFAREGVGAIDLTAAWNYTGRWLLTVSVRHPAADERLALARRAFERALALTPGDAQARAGLELARGGPLSLYAPSVIAAIEALGRVRGEAADEAKPAGRREALEALLKEERRRPAPLDQIELASRFRGLGDPAHADGLLAPVRARFGWKTSRLTDLAQAALAKRDFETALAALLRAETTEPAAAAALYARLADADQATRKRVAESAPAASPKPEAAADDRKQWIDRAEASARKGDERSARAALERAEALAPSDDALLRLSGVHRLLRDPKGARALLDRIKTPTDEVLLESAEVSVLDGKRADALASLSRARPSLRLARLYQALGEYAAASTALDVLIRKAPSAELHGDRGLDRHLAGRGDAAVEDLKRAVELDPDFLPPYLTLGAVYESRGKTRDALAAYEAALARPKTAGNEDLRRVLLRSRDEARRRR